ncbi:cytochrome b5 domain-containing protein RLF [Physcomitrium patens]|uniref:Cytochrome b5 heme-binding domain-containing protein n=1 Tax=Physcomitrium patens TaxID=3218 RepID=A0A2K1IWB2_PHYPA|nr:cytochrome b5 domain-containing protein RLF-like isoform X1 [Physcomitrium patens]PNR33564.1 hypothetical protein PHYPA_025508 [Physcomitrium patens]|eukprot:XP_024357984.1 cytochrome b5 domain-containing protein RLF-like isoform X1 [Physcomitrella patens]
MTLSLQLAPSSSHLQTTTSSSASSSSSSVSASSSAASSSASSSISFPSPTPSISSPPHLSALSMGPAVQPSSSPPPGDDASVSPPTMPPPKPKPRASARVPLEKGYSQMVWLRLLQTEPDLAGLKGQSPKRLIPMEEVKQHKTEEDAWTVLRGRVYNISPYIRFHPGGKDMLMKGAGRDCTALFNKYHVWVNAEFLMEKCLVGILDVPQTS